MTDDRDTLPGEPPAHGRNWQPATTIEDYARNCREGLEVYSDRRAAKILGWPRIQVYRAKLMATIPEAIFEALLAADVTSTKALTSVALALRRDDPFAHDDEHCPRCSYLLRHRRHVSKKAATAILKAIGEADAAE